MLWRTLAVMLLAATPALAQPTRPVPVPDAPQRTTASFQDWILRCERPGAGVRTCEAAQIMQMNGKPVAQIAFGHGAAANPMRFTVLVPTSVTLATPARLSGETDQEPATDLGWRRCAPIGCVADLVLTDDLLRKLRARTAPARIAFQDAAGQEIRLPVSFKGLPQALDALAKEDAK